MKAFYGLKRNLKFWEQLYQADHKNIPPYTQHHDQCTLGINEKHVNYGVYLRLGFNCMHLCVVASKHWPSKINTFESGTNALLHCNITTLIRLAIVPPVSHSAVCSTCHASSSRPLSCSSPAICRPELQINKPSSIISPPPASYQELTHLRHLCLLSVEGSRQVTGAMPHPFTTISPRSGSEHWVDCLITLHTLHSLAPVSTLSRRSQLSRAWDRYKVVQNITVFSYFKLGKGKKTIEDMFLMFILVHSLCVNSVIPVWWLLPVPSRVSRGSWHGSQVLF